ncbi:MAG: YicC family protein [Treponema sp.]|nr:YicC family protein [Treponema sp.]
MISMTGFAYREMAGESISVTVEIKGYNNRFLDVYVNMPPWLVCLEPVVKELITSLCGRGKVEIFIRVREHNAPLNVSVNTTAAKAYYQAINTLAAELGTGENPGLAVLLGMEGVLEIEKNRDEERYWQAIEPVLKEAAQAFCDERRREGKHTEEDILKSIEKIENSLKAIISFVPELEASVKENIRSRFAECLGNQIDENRILAETAALLVKYTISEEVSRLSSHLAEFRAETQRNQQPGKKLDFLCQEINREINTIGSKSVIFDVSTEVVKMKEALENVREQLRNVE